jgi:cysteine desulfurase/selenocysteine lyase
MAGMAETPLPRAQFPVADRYAYLNHAGVGPMSDSATDAVVAAAIAFRDDGGLVYERYDEQMEQVRASAATLMGVPLADVAFVKNTTEGIALAASGIDWQPGDRVVVPNYEFPSNVYPWIALRDRDVQVDLIEPNGPRRELPLELFADALAQDSTRVVAVSWVQFGYGWQTDLAALGGLCREHGALLCVDAIQGLGVLPAKFEEWGVDVASADAHKWLLGPHGIGIASVSPRAREQLRPIEPGWASVPYREDWDNLELVFDDTARRFEGGAPNVLTIAGMGASIDLLLDAGIAVIWRHVDALCQRLANGLHDLGAELRSVHDSENRSAIVSFVLPGHDSDAVVEALEARGILARVRAGAVRLSPHGYNSFDEIDSTLAAIATVI